MAAITATSHGPEDYLVPANRKTLIIFWLIIYLVPASWEYSNIISLCHSASFPVSWSAYIYLLISRNPSGLGSNTFLNVHNGVCVNNKPDPCKKS